MDQTPEREELLIDFSQVVKGIWHRRKLMAAAMIAACLLGILYGFFSYEKAEEKQRAYVYFYVGNIDYLIEEAPYLDSAESTMAAYIANTYSAVLSLPSTLQTIIDEGELSYTCDELREMLTTAQTQSTRIYQVNAYSEDPDEAVKIAGIISRVLPVKMEQIVGGTDTRVIGEPVLEEKTEKTSAGMVKRAALFGAAAALAGLVLACGLIAVKEIFNNAVYDERYLRRAFPQVPVMGAIPDLKKTGGSYADALRKEAGR